MQIHRFTDDPALTEQFVRFGRDHYRGDDNWIARSTRRCVNNSHRRTASVRGAAIT